MLQDIFAAQHQRGPKATGGGVVLAGGAGHLGSALVRQLSAHAELLGALRLMSSELHQATPLGISDLVAPEGPVADWPAPSWSAQSAVIAFEPRRDFYQRETAIWVPEPGCIAPLCRWLHAGGVRHLVLVVPHTQAQLPQGLRSALASLDEQAVASVGFDHVILLRAAQAPKHTTHANPLERLAHAMLSIVRYMIPERERPVRAQHIAELAAECLAWAAKHPQPAVRVASPETVWQIATAPNSDVLRERARLWLSGV